MKRFVLFFLGCAVFFVFVLLPSIASMLSVTFDIRIDRVNYTKNGSSLVVNFDRNNRTKDNVKKITYYFNIRQCNKINMEYNSYFKRHFKLCKIESLNLLIAIV